MSQLQDRIAGALAGMVLGDAFGVPGELWPRAKVRERFDRITEFLDGPADNIVACYFKAGHYTDDSAQAFVVLNAIEAAGTVPPVQTLAKDLIAWVESMNGFEINLLGPSSKASLLAWVKGEDALPVTKLSLTNGAAMRIAPVGCLIEAGEHEKIAEASRKAITGAGLNLYLKSGFSSTVTVFVVPEGTTAAAILDGVKTITILCLQALLMYLQAKSSASVIWETMLISTMSAKSLQHWMEHSPSLAFRLKQAWRKSSATI